jgi:ATP-dependent RNA helicase DDX49/DBP8
MDVFLKNCGVSEVVLKSVRELAYKHPTPVQQECIPKILKGEQVSARAPTGTGKTAAFAIPIVELLSRDPYGVFGVILTPTRELAIQIDQQFQMFGSKMNIRTETLVGGLDMVHQGKRIIHRLPHIVIATPGRLAYLLEQPDIAQTFQNIRFIVIDESDFLQENLKSEMDHVLERLPKCNILHFSATLDEGTDIGTRAQLDEKYVLVPDYMKDTFLARLLERYKNSQVLVFTASCAEAQIIAQMLEEFEFKVLPLHSIMSQHERARTLHRFRNSTACVLIATDVASRGLDLPQVEVVINHNVPKSSKTYIHRVGRTARAGKSGLAITLVSQYEVAPVLHIEKKLQIKLGELLTESDYKKLEDEVMDFANKIINAKALVMHVIYM